MKATQYELTAYGVKVLLRKNPKICELKKQYIPVVHGWRVWSSTWLLIDYLEHRGLHEKIRVMEIGCGWGLAGIYCAKKYSAYVTCVDIDSQVFPYSQLHAGVNDVNIRLLKRSFGRLGYDDLANIDVLLGADVCFWKEMIEPLKRLIRTALRSGVRTIAIADPGRETFEEVGTYFARKKKAKMLDWSTREPRDTNGRILEISEGHIP